MRVCVCVCMCVCVCVCVTGSVKTFHVRMQFLTIFKCHNLYTIWSSIVEISVSV